MSTARLTSDSETVNQVIVPDLEGYTTEVRLRGHLGVSDEQVPAL